MNFLKTVSQFLISNEKKYIIYLFILSLITSFLELAGIGMIVPLLYTFLDKEALVQNEYIILLRNHFSLDNYNELVIFIVIIFILVILLKSLIFTLHGYLQLKYFSNIHIRIVKEFYRNYIYSPWSLIMHTNTAVLLRNFQQGINDYTGKILSYLVAFFSEIILIIVFSVFLFVLYPIVSLSVFLFLAIITFISQRITKTLNYKLGAVRQKFNVMINKIIIQSFRVPKLLKIMGKEEKFIEIFENAVSTDTKSKYLQQFMEKLPKIWIEFIFAIIIICSLYIFISLGNEYNQLLNLLIIFGLVASKLLPSINKLLLIIQNIRYTASSVSILKKETEKFNYGISKILNKNKIQNITNYEINLNNVNFKYKNSEKIIFNNLNLSIKENTSLAIIGKSGVGKSTLGDLIIGVLKPNSGSVLVGDKDINDILETWLSYIGYVPQETYIFDDTLKKNIALGVDEDKVDEMKIKEIINILELETLTKRSKDGINLVLGDNGVKLSGGQKQRIGIARALYINPKVLILDESTSFLDIETEKKILTLLSNLKKQMTIIFITHRETAKNFCDDLIDLNQPENFSV